MRCYDRDTSVFFMVMIDELYHWYSMSGGKPSVLFVVHSLSATHFAIF